jgi:DNA-directed RNA polymerase subunit K/omega
MFLSPSSDFFTPPYLPILYKIVRAIARRGRALNVKERRLGHIKQQIGKQERAKREMESIRIYYTINN